MYLEEDQQDHDQMPVAKKYEMLGDRDATKLKLELEGGSGEKHHRGGKKGAGTKVAAAAVAADTAITTNDKDQEQESKEKKEEEMDTSDVIATGEESTVEDVADQSIKEDNATNESATNKENQPAAYDPKVAIGKNYMQLELLFNNNLQYFLFYSFTWLFNVAFNYIKNKIIISF